MSGPGFVQNGPTAVITTGILQPTITLVTDGNALIVKYSVDVINAVIAAPTDSAGQTWVVVATFANAAGSGCIAWLKNAKAGTHTLSFATRAAAQQGGIEEVNGLTGIGGTPVSNSTTAATITSPSYTPASASEYVSASMFEAGTAVSDAIHCTTAAFQSLGSLSDSTPHACTMVNQNGNTQNGVEANATIVNSTAPLTCAWAWTGSVFAFSMVAGFTFAASAASPRILSGRPGLRLGTPFSRLRSPPRATDFQSAPIAGTAAIVEPADTASGSSPPVGSAAITESAEALAGIGSAGPSVPTLRQSVFNNWPGQSALGDPQSLTQSLTLPSAVLPGSTMVLVGTLSNGGAVVASPTYSESGDGTWGSGTKLQQIDDTGQLQSMFLHCLQNTAGGWNVLNITFANFEWQGAYLQEWVNVPAASVIASTKNLQSGITATTTDLITSTGVAGAGAVAILLGFSAVTGDNNIANGGSGQGRPLVGTGFSGIDDPGVWNDHGEENTSTSPVMRVESQFFSSGMGTVAATFTGTGGTDSYASFGLALLGQSPTGSAAIAEGQDISSAAGTAGISGTAAIPEPSDTVTASGATADAGSGSPNEANDTVTASGGTAVAGSGAPVEPADTVTASGATAIPGSGAPVQPADVVAASGSTSDAGSGSPGETADVINATGAAADGGSGAIVEPSDTVSGSGTTSGAGVGAAQEQPDVIAASGSTSDAGSGAPVEPPDIVAGAGIVGGAGVGAILEPHDTVVGAGALSDSGSAAIPEPPDTVAGSGSTSDAGTGAAAEGHDTVTASGTAGPGGIGAAAEQPDAVTGAGQATDGGSGASIELPDIVTAAGATPVSGSGSAPEAPDTIAAAGTAVAPVFTFPRGEFIDFNEPDDRRIVPTESDDRRIVLAFLNEPDDRRITI